MMSLRMFNFRGLISLAALAALALLFAIFPAGTLRSPAQIGSPVLSAESQAVFSDMAMLSVLHDVQVNITHAEEKHPGEGDLVRDCLENGSGAIQLWVNPDTGHCIEVTLVSGSLDNGRFGVRVVKQVKGLFEELTGFIDDADTLWDLEKYLIDGGYMDVWRTVP